MLFGLFRWIFLVYMHLYVLFRGTFVYCVGEPLCIVQGNLCVLFMGTFVCCVAEPLCCCL